jgi:hypothetical protein
LRLLAR